VVLVKPQFEAGRAEARKGVVRDPAVHARVLDDVSSAAREVGLTPAGSVTSPITGAKGNQELLLHLRT
jgi:23S rRNA (cytidine1920-2'-O)/16S rRNA (cytidine1409-2'-O)-methyltransferase